MTVGQVISGEFGKILIRQKCDKNIELGELLAADTKNATILLQVYDLIYGSQISQQNLELISGLNLEENEDFKFLDAKLRNYKLAVLKNLITINKKNAKSCKVLPDFFSTVREVGKEDLGFITTPKNPLFFGFLRSGSKVLDVPISLPGEDVLSHHVLIAATTGKGKSNLLSVMLWNAVGSAGFLVLDPHDEYYGRNKFGLKDNGKDLSYYTPKNPPTGCNTLKINLSLIRPSHFDGAVNWSDAQKEALYAYHRKYKEKWIEAILLEKEAPAGFIEATINVVRRRLLSLLSLNVKEGKIFCKGIFDIQAGQTTISDIADDLENSKTVIIDTSSFSGSVEILIGSLVSSAVLNKYRIYKSKGVLREKPVISIVLEEAPRVLGKEVLESGPNIFSTIAREGRKFKIGLIAVTQLPSLIPRSVLANINTKVILGIEMAPERQAIIESASQDLSQDSRNIAALDKGEAIITSNFARFASPVKVPLFQSYEKKAKKVKKDFSAVV
ncbi:ATP-binding protein [Candidatus Woesearchaeota archaeon]|nr:ATP-binding protein [Candidatus Woesearchaeota archaeon]